MASPNFSGTVTGGIQDISALLPLLGTEQCEKHIGSALDRGFLYSSVTPISIFGSLGIVRAAFNILIASLRIPQFQFLGATKLHDGGFAPNGTVAPMITLDPAHPRRFLAESRLEAMLADEHIENVEDLTITSGEGITWWNFLLVLFTAVIASAGLLPYIAILRNSPHLWGKFLFSSGWGFPVCRVAGSAICVNTAQFLIEIRILVLLKTRLLFLTIDRLAKEEKINLDTQLKDKTEKNQAEENADVWSADLASEKCIWALERWLQPSNVATDPEKVNGEIQEKIREIFKLQHKRQLETMNKAIPPWLIAFLWSSLVVGIALSVGGYIGCFYLVQHSTNDSLGPIAWLVVEALLSIVRILVWAVNPTWDDSRGIVFNLQLASHSPLITCNKFQDDIEEDGAAPVTRANSFLEAIVAYTGPLPLLNVNDVALYYILTAKGATSSKNGSSSRSQAILYIVISDFKEQTSRILFKEGDKHGPFSIYISTIEPIPGSTAVNVKVDFSPAGRTEPKTHFFTADPRFMDRITTHYDEILAKLQKQGDNEGRKDSFRKSWAMQHRPLSTDQYDGKNDLLRPDDSVLLSREDMIYLYQGQVERQWRFMLRRLEEWKELYIALYAKELFEDVPIDRIFKETEPLDVIHMYEANEVEYLLIECRTCMERLVMETAVKWSHLVRGRHEHIANAVLDGSFKQVHEDAPQPHTRQHGEEIRKGELSSRLSDERKDLLKTELRLQMENRRSCMHNQADTTEKRIRARKYNDPVGDKIAASWKEMTEKVERATVADADLDDKDDYIRQMSPYSLFLEEQTRVYSGHGVGRRQSSPATYTGDDTNKTEISTILQNEFKKKMQARLQAAFVDDRMKDKLTTDKKVSKQFEYMGNRCSRRADQLFMRMEDQRLEFEELQMNNVLTAKSHDLVAYWGSESLQERLRLMGRSHTYLRISDHSVQAVGGRANMTRALSRSQDFAYIDMGQSSQFTPEDIQSLIMGGKLITGLSSRSGRFGAESVGDIKLLRSSMNPRVVAALEAMQDVCFYGIGSVTDTYRKGNPYLLFRSPGSIVCIVYFHVFEKRDHFITLQHCMTTGRARVDISLNGHALERTWGTSQEVIDNFENEDIFLPEAYLKDAEEPNTLRVVLAYNSPGAYWLSNVLLPVQSVVRSETPEPIPEMLDQISDSRPCTDSQDA